MKARKAVSPNVFDRQLALQELRYMASHDNPPLFQGAFARLGLEGMLADDPNLVWLYQNGWVAVNGPGLIVTDAGRLRCQRHCPSCTCDDARPK